MLTSVTSTNLTREPSSSSAKLQQWLLRCAHLTLSVKVKVVADIRDKTCIWIYRSKEKSLPRALSPPAWIQWIWQRVLLVLARQAITTWCLYSSASKWPWTHVQLTILWARYRPTLLSRRNIPCTRKSKRQNLSLRMWHRLRRHRSTSMHNISTWKMILPRTRT